MRNQWRSASVVMSQLCSRRPSRGGSHDWLSRDTQHIDCQATGCKFNVAKTCAVPTRCVIKADGGCAGFEAKTLGPKQGD